MRVLNTQTKGLEEISDNEALRPSYAILSHCWRDEEVSFQDMFRPNVEEMKGYAKLSAACDAALRLGFGYLWMDTCCIDKSSSSELSEAINSMFKWYKSAALCIVYLDDVDGEGWTQTLGMSRWFTRGWTLQELIAPSILLFFSKDWTFIRTKASIAEGLASITGIDKDVLLTRSNMEGVSVAARMSWAAGRHTARPEDRAYSLMGIFGVNMATIYGEGDKAFVRLQEEIMKKSDDQSIFAWDRSGADPEIWDNDRLRDTPACYTEMLARDPDDFRDKNHIVQIRSGDALHELTANAEFTLTNRGIRIRLPIRAVNSRFGTYIAVLACKSRVGDCAAYGIPLHHVSNDQYIRFSFTRGVNLIAIQDSRQKNSNRDFIFIAQDKVPMYAPFMDSAPTFTTQIHLAPLRHALVPYNLTFHPEPGDDIGLHLESSRETFLFIINQVREIMCLLIMTYDGEDISVKAITRGASGGRNQPSLQKIYETWRDGQQQQLDLQHSSHSPVVRMADGREIEFVAIGTSYEKRKRYLLAVPVGM